MIVARRMTVSELEVSVPLILFVLDTVCYELRVSADTDPDDSTGL
jgi:hypothetical protein